MRKSPEEELYLELQWRRRVSSLPSRRALVHPSLLLRLLLQHGGEQQQQQQQLGSEGREGERKSAPPNDAIAIIMSDVDGMAASYLIAHDDKVRQCGCTITVVCLVLVTAFLLPPPAAATLTRRRRRYGGGDREDQVSDPLPAPHR